MTSADLEKVKAERLEKVKPSTVNRELAFLKHVYNVAIRDGKTERSPFARLRLLREPSGRVRYLTDEEEAALVKKLPTEADRDRLRVLVHSDWAPKVRVPRAAVAGPGFQAPPKNLWVRKIPMSRESL